MSENVYSSPGIRRVRNDKSSTTLNQPLAKAHRSTTFSVVEPDKSFSHSTKSLSSEHGQDSVQQQPAAARDSTSVYQSYAFSGVTTHIHHFYKVLKGIRPTIKNSVSTEEFINSEKQKQRQYKRRQRLAKLKAKERNNSREPSPEYQEETDEDDDIQDFSSSDESEGKETVNVTLSNFGIAFIVGKMYTGVSKVYLSSNLFSTFEMADPTKEYQFALPLDKLLVNLQIIISSFKYLDSKASESLLENNSNPDDINPKAKKAEKNEQSIIMKDHLCRFTYNDEGDKKFIIRLEDNEYMDIQFECPVLEIDPYSDYDILLQTVAQNPISGEDSNTGDDGTTLPNPELANYLLNKPSMQLDVNKVILHIFFSGDVLAAAFREIARLETVLLTIRASNRAPKLAFLTKGKMGESCFEFPESLLSDKFIVRDPEEDVHEQQMNELNEETESLTYEERQRKKQKRKKMIQVNHTYQFKQLYTAIEGISLGKKLSLRYDVNGFLSIQSMYPISSRSSKKKTKKKRSNDETDSIFLDFRFSAIDQDTVAKYLQEMKT